MTVRRNTFLDPPQLVLELVWSAFTGGVSVDISCMFEQAGKFQPEVPARHLHRESEILPILQPSDFLAAGERINKSSKNSTSLTSICQTTIAWGVVGGARYARRSHYQTARYSILLSTSSYIVTSYYSNLAYYQPNIYHYHSTPWRYRWGRFVLENFHGDHWVTRLDETDTNTLKKWE